MFFSRSAALASVLAFGLIAAALLVVSPAPAPAQTQSAQKPGVATADDEFSRQLSELKKSFADLSKKFDESAQSIDRLNSAEAARKEIEELREHVGKLLAAVADNGTVWTLGSKALSRAEDKLKQDRAEVVVSHGSVGAQRHGDPVIDQGLVGLLGQVHRDRGGRRR